MNLNSPIPNPFNVAPKKAGLVEDGKLAVPRFVRKVIFDVAHLGQRVRHLHSNAYFLPSSARNCKTDGGCILDAAERSKVGTLPVTVVVRGH